MIWFSSPGQSCPTDIWIRWLPSPTRRFSNYTSDADENVQKITPAYAKFKQSEMVQIVEDETAKDDSVDPKDIESIIEHRNAVAKQAENNSGMSL